MYKCSYHINYYPQDDITFLQSDEVYLEAQIQNLTAGPICLEKVALESSHLFSGKLSLVLSVCFDRKSYILGVLHFSVHIKYERRRGIYLWKSESTGYRL